MARIRAGYPRLSLLSLGKGEGTRKAVAVDLTPALFPTTPETITRIDSASALRWPGWASIV